MKDTIAPYTQSSIIAHDESKLAGTLIHATRRSVCELGDRAKRVVKNAEAEFLNGTFDINNPRHVAVLLVAVIGADNVYIFFGPDGDKPRRKNILYANCSSWSQRRLDGDEELLRHTSILPYGKNLHEHLHIVKGR